MSAAPSWKNRKITVSPERAYEVLRAPLITEKATLRSQDNQVAFKVRLDSNKSEIRAAIEFLFKVQVKAVNTIRVKGKVKRFRGKVGQRSDFKKAYVTLAEGQTLDISTGLS